MLRAGAFLVEVVEHNTPPEVHMNHRGAGMSEVQGYTHSSAQLKVSLRHDMSKWSIEVGLRIGWYRARSRWTGQERQG